MRSCHRPNATVECSHEVAHRAAGLQCMTGDGADGREHVLNAMVELSNQYPLVFLCLLTLSYINADADDAVRPCFAVVGYETARLDPSHLATSTNDTILHVIFAPVLM